MAKYKYLIIGGGVAGTTAAETIRKNDPEGSLAIISDEPHRFYSRIMLSKPAFFLGKVPFDKIWLKTEQWYADNKIELIKNRRAISLDSSKKLVGIDDGKELEYEKLLLSVGAHARRWPVEGADKKGVHYYRSLDEAKGIMSQLKDAKSVVLIGSGFVSFETADLLRMAGKEVTLVMLENYYWEPLLDEKSGRMIEAALEKDGVKILHKKEVQKVLGEDKVEGVLLKDGTQLTCDMIIAGIGVVCGHDWLASSGLKTNRGILANEYLETNLPDVYTAGDSSEFNDIVLGEVVQLGNWVNAQEQGRISAMNMVGISEKKPFKFVSFYTTQGLGMGIAMVGDVRPLPDRKIISRGSPEMGAYGRIFVAGDEIVGATLINRGGELMTLAKLIEIDFKVTGHEEELGDTNKDLKTFLSSISVNPATSEATVASVKPFEKIKVGWFSFSCCEDNTIVFTEIMNDHWQEWKKIFDFRHARVLKKHNIMDEFDVSFIEGAIASPEHEAKLKDIRNRSKILVAVGACAIVGLPAGQRNAFTEDQKNAIQFLVDKFGALSKVLKVADVVKVDAEIPGCPMDPKVFLEKTTAVVKMLRPEL